MLLICPSFRAVSTIDSIVTSQDIPFSKANVHKSGTQAEGGTCLIRCCYDPVTEPIPSNTNNHHPHHCMT
jgi:hypothetical protein